VVAFVVNGANVSDLSGVVPVGARVEGQRVEFSTTDPTADVYAVTAWAVGNGARLDQLSVTRPSLEDVFLGLADAGEDL
jgi:ABC-2 type transport system ATP-binding protein